MGICFFLLTFCQNDLVLSACSAAARLLALRISNLFCFSHVSVYATSLGSIAVYPQPEGCLYHLVLSFDHRVPARNVKCTFILFTCCFNCRGCSRSRALVSSASKFSNFFQMFLICAIKVLKVPNLCGQ